jgi:microsomal dipeptidase-like Zn-dependent dipeptidase|eukprot:TRINITY_DN11443_c0_g1_i6.p1 TRINITY_DN11443_c0_g1~~TRINITY_DN11443_c0_g1_i6.p1  ORF type:complete len:403 (-),score=106.57 TRINITY_DN11443_c0_g1_i6:317-1525(-)
MRHAMKWMSATLLLATAGVHPVLAADVNSLHAAALPLDAHIDLDADFDPLKADQDGKGQFDLAKAKAGGLRGAAIAIFAPQGGDTAEALGQAQTIANRKYEAITGIAKALPERAEIALTPADYLRITRAGKFAIIESIVNGGAFVTGPADVDPWVARGVRIFGFVHAGHNGLADSSRPALVRGEDVSRHGGLSDAGKAVLSRLNKLGVLVDVSQLSDAAFDDVLALSTAPVIASHSDVRAIVDNGRNLSDAQLDRLKAKGGVVAINAFSAYLRPRDPAFAKRITALQREYGLAGDIKPVLSSQKAAEYDRRYHELRATEPRANIKKLIDAVDYTVKRIGIDHVALSSDFNHGGGIDGWQDESQARAVTNELTRRGYDAAAIAKLWSGNVLRIWGEAQKRATA